MNVCPKNVIAQLELETGLDWGLSKNRSKTRNKYTKEPVYNANKSKIDSLKDMIFYLSKSQGCVWKPKTKTWVFITAHKKDNRADVANLVDAISDATKDAIQVDDCWFSFVLDQVVDRKEIIEIKIIQESKD